MQVEQISYAGAAPFTLKKNENLWTVAGKPEAKVNAKALDEHLTLAYSRQRGLAASVVRYFNIYGPRQELGGYAVVARFATQVTSWCEAPRLARGCPIIWFARSGPRRTSPSS